MTLIATLPQNLPAFLREAYFRQHAAKPDALDQSLLDQHIDGRLGNIGLEEFGIGQGTEAGHQTKFHERILPRGL